MTVSKKKSTIIFTHLIEVNGFLFNVNEKSNNLIYWRLTLTLAIFKLYREEFFLST